MGMKRTHQHRIHVQVPLQKTTTLELLPKPKDPPADGSGSSSSSTASTKAGTLAKLVVPESVYAPIPAEREAELRKKWFEKELVSGLWKQRWGACPTSIRRSRSSAPAAVEPRLGIVDTLLLSRVKTERQFHDCSSWPLFAGALRFFAARGAAIVAERAPF